MAMYDVETVKLGGLFSKGVKVLYEQRFDGTSSEGDINTLTMRAEDGREIGKLSYATKNFDSKITAFVIHDWSTPAFVKALLKKYLEISKKGGVKNVQGEIYAKDNTTYDQIHLLKDLGFKVEAGGTMTGYQQYYISKRL